MLTDEQEQKLLKSTAEGLQSAAEAIRLLTLRLDRLERLMQPKPVKEDLKWDQ